jgi:aspartyl-tRNA(Asn)/glutamyl-tRNA(Gln) amidotransferase subunit A
MTAAAHEIWRLDALTIAREVRAKRLSPLEVVDAVLARMEALEPRLHAFCTPTPELARADAKRIEGEIMSGRDPGALAGVPVSIKDLIFTKGIRTAGGSVAYLDFIPDEDDIVVERLRRAGAVIIGKTNTSEFGYSATGINPAFETTRNPWNLERTSGGSSAGGGASVAAGIGPVAIGSDGGGSVRIPASFCGVYGLKPSFGRIPLYPGSRDERYPGFSGWESVESYGPITRTVADAALTLSATVGPDLRDRQSLPAPDFDWFGSLKGDIKGKRVAFSSDWGYAAVDPEVRRVIAEAARVFEHDLGCIVEQASPGFEDASAAFAALVVAETDLRRLRTLIAKHPGRISPYLADWMNAPWTAEQLADANIARKRVVNRMWRFMQRFDLLITPTSCVPPFAADIQGPEEIDSRKVQASAFLAFTFPINLTGQPAASVPAGFTADGLPVGLQIVGSHLDDSMVLNASAAFESARPWKDRWPPLVSEFLP